jgi:hypothetical protein
VKNTGFSLNTKCLKFAVNFGVVILLLSIHYVAVSSASGSGIDFFSKDESPFGVPYHVWVAKYWNWDVSISTDNETNTFAGLKENGCLVHEEGSVVMLVDTAVGGKINQICKITSGQGILIPIWTGECDSAMPENEGASFKKISDCARAFDLGKVRGLVKVDNIPIAQLDVVDYTTNSLVNVTEIYTKEFNVTIPSNTHIPSDKYGTFHGAAHGWFVFLKPLPPGEHTIYYQNTVQPTTISGAANVNTAQITYSFHVG